MHPFHMAFLNLTSPRPDKHVDRSAWNKSWEDDLKQYKSLRPALLGSISIPTEIRKYARSQISQTGLAKQTRSICILQQDIRNYALPRLATDDFEGKWKELNSNRRKEVLLEALYKTSCAGPDMEDYRKWCPEMTLPSLSAENGRLFIDMLKKIITDDPTRQRTEPISFSHSMVNQIFRHDLFESIKPLLESSRCYFISLTVWRITLAFYNDDERYILSGPQELSGATSKKAALALVEKTFGKVETRLLKQELKAFKTRLTEQVNLCWHCGKDASELSAGFRLKACSKCKEIGRSIMYCSKECQTEDWRKGTPGPHKSICGRPMVEVSEEEQSQRISRPGCDSDEKIPEPDPTFKRTPALLHQIALLKHDKNSDYLLMGSGLNPDIGIRRVSDNDFVRSLFLILRRRALINGDPIAVDAMCRMLQPIALKFKFTTEQLINQLEKEYGVKVNLSNSTGFDPEPPTEEEMEWAQSLIRSFKNMPMNSG